MSENDVDTLFSQTLQGDYSDELPWEAVGSLRKLGTLKVFNRAVERCGSSNDKRRARGADVLAQIGSDSDAQTIQSFRQNALPIILEMLEGEKAALPTASAIYALGHLALPTAIPTIVNYAQHFNPDVRHAVAFALGSFADEKESVATLLTLMDDDDDAVRDWATFSLGARGTADSHEIREALAVQLDDDDEDVWFEAAIGLGRRRDRRAATPLTDILLDDPDNRAAKEAANLLLGFDEDSSTETNELLSALERLQCWGK